MVSKEAKTIAKRYREDPLIRSLRVQTWYKAVHLASGKTPAELEREFSARKDGQKLPRSCIWEKYRGGKVIPRNGGAKGGSSSLVERVEARYPGTAAWLSSPLWRLVDKAPLEMSEIRTIYEAMPPRIRSYVLLTDAEATETFWRRPSIEEQLMAVLAHFGTVDDLIVALAVWREKEASQDHDGYAFWASALDDMFEVVRWDSALTPSVPDKLLRYLKEQWVAAYPIVRALSDDSGP